MELLYSEELIINVIDRLNNDSEETIVSVLKDICLFYNFNSAFVYEADYKNRFHLRDHYKSEEEPYIPKKINIIDYFGEKDLEKLKNNPLIISQDDGSKKLAYSDLINLFEANTLLIIPIFYENKELLGFLGALEYGNLKTLPKKSLKTACSVFSIVSNRIKLKLYQTKLNRTFNFLEGIMNNMGIDIYVNDYNTHEILYVNESMAKPYGGMKNMLGKPCWQSIYDDKTEECSYCPKKHLIDENGNPTKTYSWDYERPFDKSWFHVICAAFKWVDGRTAIIVSSVDITDKKNNELLIEKIAYKDSLTGIKNRNRFDNDILDLIKRAKEKNISFHLLFIDLDRFKFVNDEYGHAVGDALLNSIGSFFKETPLLADNSYRVGGDEFVLIFENYNEDTIDYVVEFITERFSKTWKLNGIEIFCDASVGKSNCPRDGTDFDSIMKIADKDMYSKKRYKKSQKED